MYVLRYPLLVAWFHIYPTRKLFEVFRLRFETGLSNISGEERGQNVLKPQRLVKISFKSIPMNSQQGYDGNWATFYDNI